MSDVTMTARPIVECKLILEHLEKLVSLAMRKIKPEKSRSLVLEKGSVLNSNKARFKVKQQPIPTVSEPWQMVQRSLEQQSQY